MNFYSELTTNSKIPIPIHPRPPRIIETYVIAPGRKVVSSKNKKPRPVAHPAEYRIDR